MYSEGKLEFDRNQIGKLESRHFIEVGCDSPTCDHKFSKARVEESSREMCIRILFVLGWRLHQGKQLCPTCAGKVTDRLAKRLDKRSAS